jgi:hypothetical protein
LAKGVVACSVAGKRFFESISGCRKYTQKSIIRRAPLAVALITCHYCAESAAEFWKQVAFVDGIKTGDPRKLLHEFLVSVGVNGGGALSSKKIASTGYICRAVSAAWNAYLEGRELKQIKAFEEAPIKILGTPWIGDKKDNDIQVEKFSSSLSFP